MKPSGSLGFSNPSQSTSKAKTIVRSLRPSSSICTQYASVFTVLTLKPVSSSTSRLTACSAVSPCSTMPPGTV